MTVSADRALIVEDDHSWQMILAEILTDSGLVVDTADNLEKAAAVLRGKAHRLAVIDLSLGGIDHHNQDGLRVLDMLRYHDPNCQTILLTGFATVELAVSALTEHGALTCLRKETFLRAEFRELVRRALAKAPPKGGTAHPSIKEVGRKPAVSGVVKEKKDFLVGEEDIFSRAALVVEDDAGWRSIFLELLTDAGFRVRLTSSFGEGLGYLRREKYALAIVDLSLDGSMSFIMSEMDEDTGSNNLEGYRLLTSTRAGNIPTIVVSGISTPADIERAYTEQGIFAFLQKQVFNRQIFLQTVKDAMAAGRTNRKLENLTEREREVLDLLAQGLTNKEIAEALIISTNTVKRHLKAIFQKLDIHTRSAAAMKVVSGGNSVDKTETGSGVSEPWDRAND